MFRISLLKHKLSCLSRIISTLCSLSNKLALELEHFYIQFDFFHIISQKRRISLYIDEQKTRNNLHACVVFLVSFIVL